MNFAELGLTKRICAVLEKLGFEAPTEIQSKAIPVIIAGQDVLASAETGSGKTAAYALPLIQNLKGTSERKPRCLVLVPTRELALQVQTQFDRFSNGCGMRTVTVYGGTGYEKQTRLLRRGVDVIVATPGRLTDHIERGNADLSNVSTLVLDEADRMLDMGFLPQVRRIVEEMENRKQTLMFSATISKSIEKIAAEFLSKPVTVSVNTKRVEPSSIEQRIYHIDEAGKDDLLVQLMQNEPELLSVLVFTQTRRKAAKVKKKLCLANVTAEEIHGDISQSQREKTLARYREGKFSVLVATDIAARGLDIPAISHVVNYDLPMSPADYVHRIGRTGRAGRSGVALSFVSKDQRHLMRDIERITGRALDPNAPQEDLDGDSRRGSKRRFGGNRSGSGNFRSGNGANRRVRSSDKNWSSSKEKSFDGESRLSARAKEFSESRSFTKPRTSGEDGSSSRENKEMGESRSFSRTRANSEGRKSTEGRLSFRDKEFGGENRSHSRPRTSAEGRSRDKEFGGENRPHSRTRAASEGRSRDREFGDNRSFSSRGRSSEEGRSASNGEQSGKYRSFSGNRSSGSASESRFGRGNSGGGAFAGGSRRFQSSSKRKATVAAQ